MSIVIKDSTHAQPIARVKKEKTIIYLLETDDSIKPIKKNSRNFKCPRCGKSISKKDSFLYHIKNSCDKKLPVEVRYRTDNEIIPIPLEMHNILFISGPPRSGKTYYVNQYAKSFKKIFDRTIFYFTRNPSDPSLQEDIYTKIMISEITEPILLETLRDSLCIFDDIEDSTVSPKVIKYVYSLINDICKNGRHENISIAFLNQEMTMHQRTKCILSQMTELVIFPQYTSKYNATYVMHKYLGMNQKSIEYVYTLPSRWVSLRRIAPQYAISQHEVYMIGCEMF